MFETQGGTRNRTQDLPKKGSAFITSSDHWTIYCVLTRQFEHTVHPGKVCLTVSCMCIHPIRKACEPTDPGLQQYMRLPRCMCLRPPRLIQMPCNCRVAVMACICDVRQYRCGYQCTGYGLMHGRLTICLRMLQG